jgi:hypothetical protein
MRCLSHDLDVPRQWAEHHPVVPSYRREPHVCSNWVGELVRNAHREVRFVHAWPSLSPWRFVQCPKLLKVGAGSTKPSGLFCLTVLEGALVVWVYESSSVLDG